MTWRGLITLNGERDHRLLSARRGSVKSGILSSLGALASVLSVAAKSRTNKRPTRREPYSPGSAKQSAIQQGETDSR